MKYNNTLGTNFNNDRFSLKKLILVITMACIIFMSCGNKNDGSVTKPESKSSIAPLFNNSIVSTKIDFIKSSDPDAFLNLSYKGQEKKEMPDSRSNQLFDQNTYVFEAIFTDNIKIEIWVHSSFASTSVAQQYASKVAGPLGKLPNLMRTKINHIVLLKGDGTNSSEDEGGFIILYSDKIDTRIVNNDLEETVFHESAHVSFDIPYVKSGNTWKQLQTNDNNNFITVYAKNNPNREDLAEFALFAYTMIVHPNRLSSEIEDWVETNNPNRLAFFKTIFK
ncbi:hypothetical protein [Algibacter pectinivorans]|uniref:Uncharacterized protein n=1 Tax=Algibacter pectinivorans TaxID=870482 RepID=A0A1I1RK56_9FLAO|nr:hypothetical protein [Algibacter pectinivorans]SFD34664.1 hypothetical protein SAMN04487987_11058 [Algibacter pectinivorans]